MTLPIRPLHDKILFAFEERAVTAFTGQRTFQSTSDAGIVTLGNHDDSAKTPRWGVVMAVGSEVSEDIKVGTRILIGALRWSSMMSHEGADFWQTIEDEVLVIEDA